MFDGFQLSVVDIGDAVIRVWRGRKGSPILLLTSWLSVIVLKLVFAT